MADSSDEQLVAAARGGDGDARKALAERAGLRSARAILGTPAERSALLKELVRGQGPTPALGPLLAAIAGDETGEARRAAEALYRAGQDRWGPPERAAIGRFAVTVGAGLGGELALELLEWAAQYPGDPGDFVRAAVAALADTPTDAWERIGWRAGFEQLVLRDAAAAARWSAQPAPARATAKALLSAHARGKGSAVSTLDAIWTQTADRATWASALGEALGQNHGMAGREAIAAWGWERFCAAVAGEDPAAVAALYAAFRGWRDLWVERRNATPKAQRPGGESAPAHLALWGGLDVEQLSSVVDEATRLARESDWTALVDTTFDLAEAAPVAQRLHAYAGACRISHEVTNRVRGEQRLPGLEAAADRLIVRSEAACAHLRDTGAVLDQIVANRVEDLETNVRLIREVRERIAESAERDRERAAAAAARVVAAEQARLQQEEAVRRAAEQAREAEEARKAAQQQRGLKLGAAATTGPGIPVEPIDDELFFPALPAARTLLAYARFFKQLTGGGDAIAVLAAEGVSLEAVGVINQTWSQLFSQRTDLAIRFSALISAPWR